MFIGVCYIIINSCNVTVACAPVQFLLVLRTAVRPWEHDLYRPMIALAVRLRNLHAVDSHLTGITII